MKGLFTRTRFHAAIGLIAAYAIALQALFAAFAPLPANAHGADFGQLSVICFGSGSGSMPSGDGEAPSQPSGKFHCVLCGSLLAGAALTPGPVVVPVRLETISAAQFSSPTEAPTIEAPARAGSARAPPLTV